VSPAMTDPFGGSLSAGRRAALVVVDMVRAYAEPQFPLFVGERAAGVVASIERLLSAARTAGVPIVFTGVRYEPGGTDGGVFFRKVPVLEIFVGDSAAGQLVTSLGRRHSEPLVLKQYPSAFFGTSLASTLHASGVDTVVLCGVSTSGCIRASATDAMQHGFVPLVVRDAVGDRSTSAHDANLADIAAKVGDVVDEAAAIDVLSARP
jgi:maleamate amidohydrolase